MIKRFKKTGKVFIFAKYGEVAQETIEGYKCYVQKTSDGTSLVMGNMEEFTRSRRSALRVNYDVVELIYSGQISDFNLPEKDLLIYYVAKDDFYVHQVKGIELEEEVEEDDIAPFEKTLDAIEGEKEEDFMIVNGEHVDVKPDEVSEEPHPNQDVVDAIAEVFKEEPKEESSEPESGSTD